MIAGYRPGQVPRSVMHGCAAPVVMHGAVGRAGHGGATRAPAGQVLAGPRKEKGNE